MVWILKIEFVGRVRSLPQNAVELRAVFRKEERRARSAVGAEYAVVEVSLVFEAQWQYVKVTPYVEWGRGNCGRSYGVALHGGRVEIAPCELLAAQFH